MKSILEVSEGALPDKEVQRVDQLVVRESVDPMDYRIILVRT